MIDDVLGVDILNGGAGNDILRGGAGDDVYVFNRGDDQDRVIDTEGKTTIRFGDGLTYGDVIFERVGEGGRDLKVKIAGSTDEIVIENMARIGRYTVLEFADRSIRGDRVH